MADENVNTADSGLEVEHSPAEQEALESGWVPKDEYKGDEHKWVDAAEFLRRGELFKKIEDQSKQLKDVRKALADMAKLHSQVREVEYKRAIDSLKQQRKEALADGDVETFTAVEEKIEAVKEQQDILKAQPAPVQEDGNTHPEFQAWVAQNSWYNNNAPMKAFADALGADLSRAGNSPDQVLKKVAAAVREEFPKRFTNPNRDKPGTVESGQARGRSTSSGFTLTDEERQIMNRFIRTGAIKDEKEYIESLKKVRS
jgi:hypothetical protein